MRSLSKRSLLISLVALPILAYAPLGKGAVLMAAAYPNRTSPVLRGSFILEYITGAPPARPPLNVPAFPESEIGTAKARTVRMRRTAFIP